MPHHRFEQNLHTVDVVVEIEKRFLHALAHERVRRKMNHGLDLVLHEDRIEHGAVADVSLVKLRPRVNRTAMTRLQVVNDDDLFSLFNELMHGMRADVAGAAANENCHKNPPPNILPKLSQNAPHAFATSTQQTLQAPPICAMKASERRGLPKSARR